MHISVTLAVLMGQLKQKAIFSSHLACCAFARLLRLAISWGNVYWL